MSKQFNFILNRLTREKRSCRECIFLNYSFFGGVDFEIEHYKCNVYGNEIQKSEVDKKSCWIFGRRKEGIPLDRQIHDHWINRLKRNWFSIVMATIAITTLTITILKAFNVI